VSIATLGLLILSAALHTFWNILLRRAGDKLITAFLQMLVSVVLLAIPVALFCELPTKAGAFWLIASALLQTAYYVLLAVTYQSGAMRTVYPLTRGSAPLFVCGLSIALGLEEIGAAAGLAILTIVAGLYITNIRGSGASALATPFRTLRDEPSSRLAFLTGLIIAAYTLVDKRSVEYNSPLLIYFIDVLVPPLVLSPLLFRRRSAVKSEIMTHGPLIVVISFATFAAYYLVLTAMKHAAASYISSVREISIVFVTLYTLARERHLRQEKPCNIAFPIIGSMLTFTGIFALSCFLR
jgi:drug/metabolite transporter (DMT)-like permease